VSCTNEELAEMIQHALIHACEDGSYFEPQEDGLVADAMINLPIAARELRKRIEIASCTDEELGEMLHDAVVQSVEGWCEDFEAQMAKDEALIVTAGSTYGSPPASCARSWRPSRVPQTAPELVSTSHAGRR
jgi:hypothetical protein